MHVHSLRRAPYTVRQILDISIRVFNINRYNTMCCTVLYILIVITVVHVQSRVVMILHPGQGIFFKDMYDKYGIWYYQIFLINIFWSVFKI